MIIQLNKHGPRSSLLQGDIHSRGNPPSHPVMRPYMMVIKPPGSRGRSYPIASSGSTTSLKYPTLKTGPPPDIAYGLPARSLTGMPPILTPRPTLYYTVSNCTAIGMLNSEVNCLETSIKAKG